MKLKLVGVALVGLTIAGTAQAQNIQQATSGLSNAASVISFDGLAANTSVTDQYSALGVIFGTGWTSTVAGFFNGSGGGMNGLANFAPCCTTPLNIFFTQAVSGTALQYVSNLGLSTFTAFLHGTQVGQFTAITGTGGMAKQEFWGFNDSVALDQIRIDAVNYNGAFVIDNLQVGAVAGAAVTATPEPASLVLLGTGFVGVFGVVRRRRRLAATV